MRLTYDKLARMTPEEIGKLKKPEMIELLKQARGKVETRFRQLDREKNLYSPAQEKLRDYYDTMGKNAPSRASRNKAMNEIFRIQEFLQSKTSTVKGAKKVMKEQDMRLFGVKEKKMFGKTVTVAKNTMTLDQRTQFWSLYNDFISTNKTAEFIYGSGRIQQELADMVIKKKIIDKSALFDELRDELADQDMDDWDDLDEPFVYSGSWNGNKR